jgi:hypothetical protein
VATSTKRVVGRRVAVDRDALNDVGGLARERCSSAFFDRGVGGDEAEHRRHVGLDHAGALAMPVTVTVRRR